MLHKRKKTNLLLLILALFPPLLWSSKGPVKPFPAPLLSLSDYFGHHILVTEKFTHKLHIFRNNQGVPELLKSYTIATGKNPGNKLFKGDHRTPEGIYFFTDFLTHQQLLERYGDEGKIYGVGAFVMNYPNPIDAIKRKTGNGIWLHSTDDETRINNKLDSRGCIVTSNKNLIDISKYIELHRTPIIVVHHLNYLNEAPWKKLRTDIEKTVRNWLTSWEQEDKKNYFAHYHSKFRDLRRNWGLSRYKKYKSAVFASPGRPEISLSHLNIVQNGEYAIATFLQHYRSKNIDDVGRKNLYLKRNNYYQWKIISENWMKNGISTMEKQPVFRPNMRFFSSYNPAQILNETKKKDTKEYALETSPK